MSDLMDWSRSYDSVYGIPGIGYYQDGKPFTPDGKPARITRLNMPNDDGSKNIVEVGSEIEEDEPEEIEAPVEEKVDRTSAAAKERQEAIDAAFDDPMEVIGVIRNQPKKYKYTSQMNVKECMEWLDDHKVPYAKSLKKSELMKLINKHR